MLNELSAEVAQYWSDIDSCITTQNEVAKRKHDNSGSKRKSSEENVPGSKNGNESKSSFEPGNEAGSNS